MTQSERDRVILSLLLEHPYLHDGLSAEAGYNYVLGRTHYDRKNEKWRKSARSFAYWMKRNGFRSERVGDINRYYWDEEEKLNLLAKNDESSDASSDSTTSLVTEKAPQEPQKSAVQPTKTRFGADLGF